MPACLRRKRLPSRSQPGGSVVPLKLPEAMVHQASRGGPCHRRVAGETSMFSQGSPLVATASPSSSHSPGRTPSNVTHAGGESRMERERMLPDWCWARASGECRRRVQPPHLFPLACLVFETTRVDRYHSDSPSSSLARPLGYQQIGGRRSINHPGTIAAS